MVLIRVKVYIVSFAHRDCCSKVLNPSALQQYRKNSIDPSQKVSNEALSLPVHQSPLLMLVGLKSAFRALIRGILFWSHVSRPQVRPQRKAFCVPPAKGPLPHRRR